MKLNLKKLLFQVIVVTLICGCSVMAGETPLNSADSAAKRAFEYLGFPDKSGRLSEQMESVAKVVTVVDSTTPLFSTYIDGRKAWEITCENVYIYLEGWHPSKYTLNNPKTYSIFLDSLTGQLLKICYKDTSLAEGQTLAPPASFSDSLFQRIGERYVYHNLLDSVPPVTFIQALEAATGSFPYTTKELTAILVSQSEFEGAPTPIWLFVSREHPRLLYRGNEQPTPTDAHSICAVNGITGDWLYCHNAPIKPIYKKR